MSCDLRGYDLGGIPMAENKQYITQIQENGSVMISEEVISTIVAHAVAEVEGIVPKTFHAIYVHSEQKD